MKSTNEKVSLIILIVIFVGCVYCVGYYHGYRTAKEELPSCLYLGSSRYKEIKPEGYDGKEGVDWYFTAIEGGGMCVDFRKWKEPRWR